MPPETQLPLPVTSSRRHDGRPTDVLKMASLEPLQQSSKGSGAGWERAEGQWVLAAPGPEQSQGLWQSLPLGARLTARRNAPEMEEVINTAGSDGAARGGNRLIINLSVLIFDQMSSW